MAENKGIWQAHDAGHPACGTTMSTPDAAAFDPIFWFFHANWDRPTPMQHRPVPSLWPVRCLRGQLA
ncbi:MAG: tyrosinase family protein [Actinomycetota bacterium]|nr:tyrosinase family protein [Actinomycetota bacterium]